MKALNNTFLIQKFEIKPENGTTLNHKIDYFQPNDITSIKIKQKDDLVLTNKLELQKLEEFSQLKANWDSYGALPPDKKSIEKASDFIKTIDMDYDEEIYFIAPGPNGEISIEMKQIDKELEFIFYPDKSKYLCYSNNEFNKQGAFDNKILPELIEWLYLNE